MGGCEVAICARATSRPPHAHARPSSAHTPGVGFGARPSPPLPSPPHTPRPPRDYPGLPFSDVSGVKPPAHRLHEAWRRDWLASNEGLTLPCWKPVSDEEYSTWYDSERHSHMFITVTEQDLPKVSE